MFNNFLPLFLYCYFAKPTQNPSFLVTSHTELPSAPFHQQPDESGTQVNAQNLTILQVTYILVLQEDRQSGEITARYIQSTVDQRDRGG